MSSHDSSTGVKVEDQVVVGDGNMTDLGANVKQVQEIVPSRPASKGSIDGDSKMDDEDALEELSESDLDLDVESQPRPKAGKSNANATKTSLDELLEKINEAFSANKQFSGFSALTGKEDKKGDRPTSKGRPKRMEHTRKMKSEAEEDKALLQDELEDAEGAGTVQDVRILVQPQCIKAQLREYQLEALNWMVRLHNHNFNGILADEMGLGKTLETISLLGYLRESRGIKGPHLIIVPKSTLTNWCRELKRWCPDINVLAFQGDKEARALLREQVGKTDVIVTSYEVCIIESSVLRRLTYEYIIIDEAHRIKNENSKLSLIVRRFQARHRLLITGTPLQNNLHELWALLNFLQPNVFTSHEAFQDIFDQPGDAQDTLVKTLHKVLRHFLLRRLKTDVESALPPKVETKLFVGLSEMQRSWYHRLLSRDLDAINGSANANRTRLLNIVMQLRKVCNHPYLFDGAEPGPPFIEGEHLITNSGKMVLLDKLLQRLKEQGSRVLIFSQMTRLLDILEDYCRYRDYDYCRIDGQSKQDERDEAMDVFNKPDSKKFVFLLSTRAGGLGINLQTADTVILYDSDWNPQMDLQAQDRAHRIGQKKIVNVFRFVTEETVEEKIVERAMRKLALDALVIQKGRLLEQDKGLSGNELQAMVRFGAAFIFQSKDSTITDEDIDAILAKGKARTEADNSKLQLNENSLLTFSLHHSDDTSKGVLHDSTKDHRRASEDVFLHIAPPQRERKVNNYDSTGAPREEKAPKPKEFRPAQRYDYQFFNIKRLDELERKQWESDMKLRELRAEYRKNEREEKKTKAMIEREAKRAALRAKAEAEKKTEEEMLAEEEKLRKEEEAEEEEERRRERDGEGDGDDDEDGEGDGDEEEDGEEDGEGEEDHGDDDEHDEEEGGEEEDENAMKDTEESSSSSSAAAGKKRARSEISSRGGSSDGQGEGKESNSNEAKGDGSEEEGEGEGESDSTRSSKPKPKKQSRLAASLGIVRKPISKALKNLRLKKKMKLNDGSAQPSGKKDRHDDHRKMEDDEIEKQLQLKAGCLTQQEKEEHAKLLAEGFPDWRRADLMHFISASAQYGRNNITAICQNVEGKPPNDVKRYHNVFWKRHHEIRDHDKLIKSIERGEQLMKRRQEIEKILDAKVKQYKDPVLNLTLDYPAKQTLFTLMEDRFLVLSMRQQGYGNWEAIRRDVLCAPQFRFDWFMKSRTPTELARRGEYLLRILEREKEMKKREKEGDKKKETRGRPKKAGEKDTKDKEKEKEKEKPGSRPSSKSSKGSKK